MTEIVTEPRTGREDLWSSSGTVVDVPQSEGPLGWRFFILPEHYPDPGGSRTADLLSSVRNGRPRAEQLAALSRASQTRRSPMADFVAAVDLGDYQPEGLGPFARCVTGMAGGDQISDPHTAPDPRCRCGFRVVRNLRHLMPYLAAGRMIASWPFTFGVHQVRGFGTIAGYDDEVPAPTVRASRLAVAGVVVLPDTETGHVASYQARHLPGATIQFVSSFRNLVEVEKGAP